MRIVAIDPGNSIGFAMFDNYKLEMSGVVKSDYPVIQNMFELFTDFKPNELVIELFHLFPHKALEQSYDQMWTPQIIGIFRFWAWERNLPVVLQPPSFKQAFPDKRLERDGYYVSNIHARDAIRHGLYRLKFGEGRKK